MAGIYLHIPFCKQACHYCDFHFSVNQSRKAEVIDAIVKEIILQREYLQSEPVGTIYFGGGTPSLLNDDELMKIMSAISESFNVNQTAEITLEANPDDLDEQKLETLRKVGINRLSIGIQSFNDDSLRYMNRAHNGEEAIQSVEMARRAGFENLSIDLIYALPSNDHSLWKSDLEQALALGTEHISSYCLTIEPNTTFGRKYAKGHLKVADEDFAAQQFEMLVKMLSDSGYQHYEISNFCREGYESKHNTSYWKQEPYLGIGPSAHSYNGDSRQFNVSHNQKYLYSIGKELIPAEVEYLSQNDRINEYVFTNIRTSWGVDNRKLKDLLSYDLLKAQKHYVKTLLDSKLVKVEKDRIILTEQGKLLADEISSNLFIV